jgi:FixJ family two-component response regulator
LGNRGELPIIFLTGRGDIPMTLRAMKQGAVDFLTKPADEADLLRCVRGAIEIRRRLQTLTPREREVLEQVISGRFNKQTAAELDTVEKTIKVHRARIMEKMRVASLAELARLAQAGGR